MRGLNKFTDGCGSTVYKIETLSLEDANSGVMKILSQANYILKGPPAIYSYICTDHKVIRRE